MPKKSSIALLAILAAWLIAFILPGCSSVSLPSLPWSWSTPATQPNATAEALFDEGTAYLNNKKYALAIDRFQKVKAEFPFSPQLVPAELKLAESYYLNKQYPEAAAAFKEFQTLHPNNENIPFVLYHLGLVHFDQFTSSDRYQKVTEIAKGYFESVVKDHPGSPYAAPAKEKLAKCIEYLSEHEFNIATFYFNEKKYPAAIDRLEDILRRYRETSIAAKALYYLGESYRLGRNNIKAALAYEALIQHYAEDPLAKKAQVQLSELSKEKQDPLAMLLKKDGRPQLAPPPLPAQATASREQGGADKEKELNLVAKKEVVHEEPGEQKGVLRRVVDTINPFASSSDKKENGSKIDTAKGGAVKEESNGFFGSLWRGINPFAKENNAKTDTSRDSQLLGKIDSSLNQKGINPEVQNLSITAPAANLPNVEEATPPASNTAELLGKIDTNLKKEGKNAAELPPAPEPAAILKASNTEGQKPTAPRTESASAPATKGLIAGIDQALKQKGIEPAKESEKARTPGGSEASQPSSIPASQPYSGEKIELAPKLTVEKGPLFLDSGDYQGQEKTKESEKARTPGGLEASQPSSQLPQAVVKSSQPAPVKEKAPETRVAEKKKSPEDGEESKGTLDQLKEDFGRLRDLLNPFGW